MTFCLLNSSGFSSKTIGTKSSVAVSMHKITSSRCFNVSGVAMVATCSPTGSTTVSVSEICPAAEFSDSWDHFSFNFFRNSGAKPGSLGKDPRRPHGVSFGVIKTSSSDESKSSPGAGNKTSVTDNKGSDSFRTVNLSASKIIWPVKCIAERFASQSRESVEEEISLWGSSLELVRG